MSQEKSSAICPRCQNRRYVECKTRSKKIYLIPCPACVLPLRRNGLISGTCNQYDVSPDHWMTRYCYSRDQLPEDCYDENSMSLYGNQATEGEMLPLQSMQPMLPAQGSESVCKTFKLVDGQAYLVREDVYRYDDNDWVLVESRCYDLPVVKA